MSALTQADNDELDAQLLAQNNVIDGLSLVISRQQAVMRQALDDLESLNPYEAARDVPGVKKAITALRNSLEGKQ
jgi:uncharacterized coiled-coil protein SlyX